jgi:hypothetical protein
MYVTIGYTKERTYDSIVNGINGETSEIVYGINDSHGNGDEHGIISKGIGQEMTELINLIINIKKLT